MNRPVQEAGLALLPCVVCACPIRERCQSLSSSAAGALPGVELDCCLAGTIRRSTALSTASSAKLLLAQATTGTSSNAAWPVKLTAQAALAEKPAAAASARSSSRTPAVLALTTLALASMQRHQQSGFWRRRLQAPPEVLPGL